MALPLPLAQTALLTSVLNGKSSKKPRNNMYLRSWSLMSKNLDRTVERVLVLVRFQTLQRTSKELIQLAEGHLQPRLSN